MPPRTIDNLGVEISTRYAEDQKNLDAALVREAKGVSTQAQIDVSVPSYPSEWEILFEIRLRNLPWAVFFAPPHYAEQKRRLFTHHVLPALNTDEIKEAQIARIKARIRPKEEKEKEEERKKRPLSERWIDEREDQDEEKEKNILLHLLNCINLLDKVLMDVNARRDQYHKG